MTLWTTHLGEGYQTPGSMQCSGIWTKASGSVELGEESREQRQPTESNSSQIEAKRMLQPSQQSEHHEYQFYENQPLCHRDRTYQKLRPASKKTQSSSHPNTKDMEIEQHISNQQKKKQQNLYGEDQTRLLPQLLEQAPALNAVKGQKEELISANSRTREEKLPL